MRLTFGLREENWQPGIEEQILKQWAKEKLYAFESKTTKPIFSLDTPPPYLSGPWHVGSAIHYAQIDMIARTKRMEGFAVIFPMGLDRNGLPIEVQVEKHYKVSMHEVPRQKFLDMCAEFLDQNERLVVAMAQRLGLSCNSFENEEMYRTDSPTYRAVTQRTFIELYHKGLVYVDERPNNWCPVCGTTIADAEVEYKDVETKLTTLRFTVEQTGEELQVATTRPELLSACAAILVNPEDQRYLRLHRKTAITPLYAARIPIVPHQEARMDFGTGAVMVCSYGDYTDVRLFRELGLHPIGAIGPDGKMTELAGPYAGLCIAEARIAVLEDLRAKRLVVKEEAITHRTPTCWRSQNPIEFIAMPEYYLRQIPFIDDLRRTIDNITFFPPHHRQILSDWLDSVTRDWPISRRRYYGTEIPLWKCKKCGEPYVPPPGPYYQPWRTPPPVKACPNCGTKGQFEGEERTMDTWMDSSISPLITIGYTSDDDLFRRAFPCSIRPQGKDIVRTWLYYTLLRVYQLFNAAAFKYVWISGHGLDERGEAMHKSRGNIIDPIPIIAKYGSDAFRFWGCLEASLGSDIRFSEGRLGGAYRFLVKLWNIARFISAFPQVDDKDLELQAADQWILSELNKVIQRAREGYAKLDFHIPALELRTFAWDLFASHYVELVKGRAYSESEGPRQRAAWYTLHTVLSAILKLLAPICPFIADKLHRTLYVPDASIHLLTFPNPRPEWQTTHPTDMIVEFNAEVWRYKKDRQLSLREPLRSVVAPSQLKPYTDDLIRMHNIRQLRCTGKGKAKIQPSK